jgi:hypothetical protein
MPKKKVGTKKSGPSLADYADQQVEARFAENQEIARTLRATRSQLREHAQELETLQERLGLYERLETSRLAPPKWLTPQRVTTKHTAIPSLLLGDIHWGEQVIAAEVGGVNEYNLAIAEQRVRRVFERSIKVCQHYFTGVDYEGFDLLLPGDVISGLIHEELRETNQETVFENVLGVVEVLTSGCTLLAEQFPRLHVEAVVGNHGRLTRKPRAKHRAKESLDWLVYQLLAKELSGLKNVTMRVAEAADARFRVYDTRYCLTHGDQFRGGTGIAAELSPLLLGVHRKMKRDAAAGNPFDLLVMGHWHRSHFLHDIIVCGSIVGYSEYAYIKNLPYEEPRAALWLTTPEHGVTLYGPIFAQDRGAEGW